MIDIDKLEALAKAATPGEWISYTPIGAALNPWEATFVAGPIPRYMDRSQGFCPADGNYIGASNPQVVLALIAEVRVLREDAAKVRKAAIFHDQLMESVHGCTDGGCLIRRPQGMHTNGGCRCARDSMKTQRVLYAARELRAAIGGAK